MHQIRFLLIKTFFSSYFAYKTPRNIQVFGKVVPLSYGHGTAHITLPNGTTLSISNVIHTPTANRNLLSVRSLTQLGFHVRTSTKGFDLVRNNEVLETFGMTPNGLFESKFTPANAQEAHLGLQQSISTASSPSWHDRLGHPGINMTRNLKSAILGIQDDITKEHSSCKVCDISKAVIKGGKINKDLMHDHSTIYADICGPIHPPAGPFQYFLAARHSDYQYPMVEFLKTRNEVSAKLLKMLIRLRTIIPDIAIKTIRVDGAREFSSEFFQRYCEVNGIDLQVSAPYTHNARAEILIKQIQLIARPLLLRSRLPLSCWTHAVSHAVYLLRLRPQGPDKTVPVQLVTGSPPNVSHLRTFGCRVYVPIPPPVRQKLGKFGPNRQLGIYVGCKSPSVVCFLDQTSGEMILARFQDCKFYETEFPELDGRGGEDTFYHDNPETSVRMGTDSTEEDTF